SSPADSPFLASPPVYGVTATPSGLAVGDFNSDGKPDVVVAANPPQILLGNSDGTLQNAVPIDNIAATDVAVADFNHDGRLDVAFAVSGGAVVYLGKGDGTFGSDATFSSGSSNQNGSPRILAADVNHDGSADLILNTDAGVSVLLGTGNGAFQPAKASSVPSGVMAAADFNKDGRLDLAVLNSSLSILLGNGDGTFSLSNSYPITYSGNMNSLASADFNQDENPDVALPDGQVFLGNGDGSLRTPATFETSPHATVVAAIDMNGDGIPDLVTSGSQAFFGGDFGTTGISLGNGDGSFRPVRVFDSGDSFYPFVIAWGDFNGDGLPDIVVSSSEPFGGPSGRAVSILLNRGNAVLNTAELEIAGGSGQIAVGDFNRDGNMDLALANGSIYLGNGDGSLRPSLPTSLAGVAVVTADFNNDTKLDLAAAVECAPAGCASGGQLAVSAGNGDGTFQPPITLSSGGFFAESLVTGDFNGDGIPDIAVLNNCVDVNCSSPGGSATIFLGKGDGSFSPGTPIALNQQPYGGNPMTIVAGDFNNDGKIDLAALGTSFEPYLFPPGVVNVLLGNGDGTFQSPLVFLTASQSGVDAAFVGDFNNDGILDLAMANGAGVCSDCNGHGSIMYGNGDGTFSAGHNLGTSGGPPVSVVAADFFGTGNLTPVLANRCGDFLDCPNGSVMIDQTLSITDIMLSFLAVGDFNNDGKPDLAGSLQFDAGASVLLDIAATLSATTTTLSPSAIQSISAFQSITFTAEIKHTGPGTPTSEVAFSDNGVSIGSASVSSNGQASLTPTQLAVGAHFVVAYYGGDSSFAPSNSLGVHVNVAPSLTTTTITASANPVAANQPVTYTATVTNPYGGAITGSVTFKDGNKSTTVPVSAGTAVLTRTYSITGTHPVTAMYSGDSNNAGSTSGAWIEYIVNLPVFSKTVITTSGSPSLINQPVTFTAAVSSRLGKIPDGETITFFAGNTAIGSGIIANGIAIFTTSSLTAATHEITATYTGDATFKGSSAALRQDVALYPSTTVLKSRPNPSTSGQPIKMTAIVNSAAPGGPTGSVTFANGTTELGTVPLHAGKALLITQKLPAGTFTITAKYSGDAQSARSLGTTSQTVK
ncbi:MAG: VCBS repeat-containing protein, partial [Acidobacteriales bacterium]|nr:VCBS repeat-containing protein [Terriglobales bacterium]